MGTLQVKGGKRKTAEQPPPKKALMIATILEKLGDQTAKYYQNDRKASSFDQAFKAEGCFYIFLRGMW
jgi:hypothetical protein